MRKIFAIPIIALFALLVISLQAKAAAPQNTGQNVTAAVFANDFDATDQENDRALINSGQSKFAADSQEDHALSTTDGTSDGKPTDAEAAKPTTINKVAVI